MQIPDRCVYRDCRAVRKCFRLDEAEMQRREQVFDSFHSAFVSVLEKTTLGMLFIRFAYSAGPLYGQWAANRS
jgi:hypothetical protein